MLTLQVKATLSSACTRVAPRRALCCEEDPEQRIPTSLHTTLRVNPSTSQNVVAAPRKLFPKSLRVATSRTSRSSDSTVRALPRGMDKLPTDVLCEILDCLDPDTEDFTSTNWNHTRRRYEPDEYARSLENISQFRLVCRRFRSLGTPYLFRCVVLRFSQKSFQKLESLAQSPHLARHVRTFVYLMPYLYSEGNRQVGNHFRDENTRFSSIRRTFEQSKDVQAVFREQQAVIQNGYDVKVLKRSMKAFSSLRNVHIRRSVGDFELAHRRAIQSTMPDTWDYVSGCWVPTCKRAIETVFDALDYGKPPIESIRCPGLSTESFLEMPFQLKNRELSNVCRNLTYLELHFDDRLHMSWMSPPVRKRSAPNDLLQEVFSAATRLERLYLGFSTSYPPNFGIESIFHGVCWENLSLLAIESWRLNADELLQLLRRHSLSLKGVRLSNIQLKEPDRWVRDLVIPLQMVFSHHRKLEWINLEGCGYESHFASSINTGIDTEAVNLALGIESPGSSDDEEDAIPSSEADTANKGGLGLSGSGIDAGYGPENDNRFQMEAGEGLQAEMLMREDTGGAVQQEQRRAWERHILGRIR